MQKKKRPFNIYIPESLCWTEVPYTRNVLRQRVRWARGLQTLYLHKSVFFNPKYGKQVY
jgi:cellulose synthase/poly-beta-1,6-N-acetylglucosamine synthase-like glycosyltransferase